jgi:RND family efflux transporter MFP subunit
MAFRWLWAAALFGALAGGCGHGEHPAEKAEEHAEGEEAHVTVRVEPARSGVVSQTIDVLGRCEALPERLAMLTPAVEGHVHELVVKQGEAVKKGQPIVELDKSVALADLAEKTATRDGLKASLALLKSLPRPEERRANELAVDAAKVAVERARALVKSLESLHSSGNLVSKQQLFDATKALEAAELQQQSAEATLHAMMIGPRPEAVAEAEARIKTAEGAVEFSKAHLEFHTIRAPIDGVLDSLTCHPGQTIAIGTPIGEVVDTRQVYAAVWIGPTSAQAVREGQKAHVRAADSEVGPAAAAKPGDGDMSGKVEFVGRIADPQTGNIPVRISVDDPQGRIAVGQTVGASIAVKEEANVLQVPVAAILDLGEGPILTVVRDGKTALLHPQLGTTSSGWVAVSGTDLKEGEPVVLEGGYNLPEGTRVKIASEKAVARAEQE